eukprot:CAMPEP_0174821980 /NCGR_PEP_ID=MMETSP1107-20130205/11943_1 /TAXON_ID=36770 /ORGANISM="Paraphysomonas vestita, Strain GFlagA" /LENGTH=421 /DNA_ID=CAMNT_0016039721 /DNA_START=187 /DNA_END=1452 /DNA_ORIENTATION=+
MAEEFEECSTALKRAANLFDKDDVRLRFCQSLMHEKKKDYPSAMDGYMSCLSECGVASEEAIVLEKALESRTITISPEELEARKKRFEFMKELSGEVMLRMAVLRKEMGALDQSMQMCNKIATDNYNDSIRANALCLKGLLHEMRAEFPSSEVVYRSALQIMGGHSTALERLGRVYLRYRETIPAAVQCFFKSVETNPSNHVAWYLLGRCYMATAQYSDACEAYNRAINLCPNDPQVWCSLGVLYYAFGQYREALGMLARALKLDPTMADAWYNVGALYDMCDQSEDAQQAYMKARENGLADRFARAGMGLNPLAMQSMQQYSAHQSQQHQQQQLHQQQLQQQQQQQSQQLQQQQSQVRQSNSSMISSQHGLSHSHQHHHDVDDHDHHDLGDIMMSQHVDEAVADYIAGAGEDDDVSHEYH